ncbi:MAG: hypothetical protein RLZZ65_1138 [Bacteroidota bacterium]|jgi:hypothetical protein
MKLSQFKSALQLAKADVNPQFIQLNGLPIAAHYHITEIGLILKNFVDCGGVVRQERKASMQIWLANDTDHRLSTEKLLSIIEKSEQLFGLKDEVLEVEFQGETVETYTLASADFGFHFIAKQTTCLAPGHCGIPEAQLPENMIKKTNTCCSPASGCC